jgi:hypothetical protein
MRVIAEAEGQSYVLRPAGHQTASPTSLTSRKFLFHFSFLNIRQAGRCPTSCQMRVGASFHQGAQSFAGCDFWAKLGGQVMAAAPILSEIRS